MEPGARFNLETDPSEIYGAVTEHGYAVIENAVDSALIDQIQRELAPYFAAGHDGHDQFMGHKTVRFGALLEKSEGVQSLVAHQSVLQLADRILLPYCLNYHIHYTGVMQLLPGEKAQVLHRDTGIFPLANPSPPFTLATMWALGDFTVENGGTQVVPASHKWNDERVPKKSEVVRVEMSAGSVLVYTGNVIHGGGANQSENNRTGLAIHYGLGWLRQEENQYLACSPETARQLPERIQSLLGYELAAPSFGFADHVHPRDYLHGVRDQAESHVSTKALREGAERLTLFSVEEQPRSRSRFYDPE